MLLARKLKLSFYTTNYVLREIAAVEFTLKMSFQKVRDELIYCFADGILDEEEFVLLYDAYKSTNSIYPYWEYDEFSLDSLSSDECLADFRVEKDDIPCLAEALRLPGRFRCSQGTLCSGLEGLCILLKRLAFPCRYYDMIYRFARPVPELCLIYNTVLRWVYENHGHRLSSWNQQFLSPIFLEQYARAIQRMGAPLGNCFGFVDGTVRPISRPDENQRIVYNGHKRVHTLKFQSVAVPNGLIANLFGPVEGRRHDAGMLDESGLLTDLQRHCHTPHGVQLCIYGDLAYPLRPELMCPFREGDYWRPLTPRMLAFNTAMSSVRVSVEWLFGDITNYFRFIDFKKNLRIGMSAVGKQYIICALMGNALTCLYGNNTSQFFGVDPPSIEAYFA